MPLDGEEHAYGEHEKLECHQDYRDPIHHFEYFQLINDTIYRWESTTVSTASAASFYVQAFPQASIVVICGVQTRDEETSTTAMQAWYCCTP
ncbi:hypothetical protein UNDYM_5874 [Undibacterium sp. YM2]|nr:hypothetical protein UNDYM_5874 [Undibacterium sp. YM2]